MKVSFSNLKINNVDVSCIDCYFVFLIVRMLLSFSIFSISCGLLSTRTPLVESDVFATQKVHQTMLQTHN